MLKKSVFSPARPLRAETRFSTGSVLASFRPSTGTRPPHHSAARTDLVLLIRRTVRPKGYASVLHSLRPCWTAFVSILRECSPIVPHVRTSEVLARSHSFSAACVVDCPEPRCPLRMSSVKRRLELIARVSIWFVLSVSFLLFIAPDKPNKIGRAHV